MTAGRYASVHDEVGHRFVVTEDATAAELGYRRNGDRLVLVHTEVPEAIAGRGVGGRFVATAADLAGADGLTILPFCPFAAGWLQDHPEGAATVRIDWRQSVGGREGSTARGWRGAPHG